MATCPCFRSRHVSSFLKHLKSSLLASLLFLIVFYMLQYFFFAGYERNVSIMTIPRTKLTPKDDDSTGKELSLFGKYYKQSLERYEKEPRNLAEIHILENTSLNNLSDVEVKKSLKQNIVCSDDLFLLIQVHSSPKNFLSRQAIRLSWGNMDLHFVDHQKAASGSRYY